MHLSVTVCGGVVGSPGLGADVLFPCLLREDICGLSLIVCCTCYVLRVLSVLVLNRLIWFLLLACSLSVSGMLLISDYSILCRHGLIESCPVYDKMPKN